MNFKGKFAAVVGGLALIATAAYAQWQIGNHSIPVGRGAGVTGYNAIAPSATSGIALVSRGVALDPSFTTVVVAGGGTNCVAASGTCLDNITGFSSTGFVKRTGAGAYSFIADPVPVANGGTNCAAASGTCLDNITGFSSTGFVKRTGAGTYTFIADPLPVANGGTGIASGTSGGVPYFSAGTTIASSGALTANVPVIGGGAGVAPSSGTRTGNTTAFATSTGALTTNNCVKTDANGNFVDAGTTCGGAGGNVTRRTISSADTIVAGDRGNLVEVTSGTFTLAFTANATLASGFYTYIYNHGTGDVTLDPNAAELIDGLSTWVLYPGGAILVQSDGSSLHSVLLAPMIKTFTGNGTFTRPGVGTTARLQVWGAGGSGGRGANASVGGGGGAGGGYNDATVLLSALGTTETVTIGTGGAAQTVASTAGTAGGNTTIGSLITGFGGGSGGGAINVQSGGGGGGSTSVGSNGAGSGGNGGQPSGTSTQPGGGAAADNSGTFNMFGGGGGGGRSATGGAGTGGASTYGGGAGGGGNSSAGGGAGAGGASYFGGGGGGGSTIDTAGAAGGTSKFGGAGGAGTIDTTVGVSGTAPGGGGGGSENANSGAGAAGQATITVY